MKRCPYCFEGINIEAVVCRYCGRDLIDPDYEYKIVYFDRIESGMFYIPDKLQPGQIAPTDDEAKEHMWWDGGRRSAQEKLSDELAQGWEVNGELSYEGVILKKNHYLDNYTHEYVTSVRAGFKCQLKRLVYKPVVSVKKSAIIVKKTKVNKPVSKAKKNQVAVQKSKVKNKKDSHSKSTSGARATPKKK